MSDTDIIYKKRKGPISGDEFFLIEKNIVEMKNILVSLGAKEENIFIYRLSEAFLRLIERDKRQVINLFSALIRFPNQELKMDPEMAKLQYRPLNYSYTIAYALRAFLDSILAANFSTLYPEDIEGKINIRVIGYGGSPLEFKVNEQLLKEDLISNSPPILITLPIPCFGRGDKSSGKFCIPDWNMGPEEIYSIISQYKVPSSHIQLFFSELLNKNLEKFIVLEGSSKKIESKPPKLALYPIDSQRLILAHNLFNFLRETKEKTYKTKTLPDFLSVSKESEMKELLRTLKSKVARDILRLTNGEYTVSELAKKLNKHISNVSRIVNELKKMDLIRIDEKRKIHKGVKTIKVNL
ncbi:MAG: winged helix-turn-helix domain-containing protein [Candidatus ainarchaeum sp.]|nr:winged helix-turn-helix domain-containing protein [Candidatus ainarchaeum sp.]